MSQRLRESVHSGSPSCGDTTRCACLTGRHEARIRRRSARPPERSHLVRIVGQQADRPEAELPKHFRCGKVDTLVRVNAQLCVGLKSVEKPASCR